MKKSQLLKEGFLKGLRKALKVIRRQLNERWSDGLINEIAQWFQEIRKNNVHLVIRGVFQSDSKKGTGRFVEEVKSMNYNPDNDVLKVIVRNGIEIRVSSFMFAWQDAHAFYGESDGVHMEMVDGHINQRQATFQYLTIEPKR